MASKIARIGVGLAISILVVLTLSTGVDAIGRFFLMEHVDSWGCAVVACA